MLKLSKKKTHLGLDWADGDLVIAIRAFNRYVLTGAIEFWAGTEKIEQLPSRGVLEGVFAGRLRLRLHSTICIAAATAVRDQARNPNTLLFV